MKHKKLLRLLLLPFIIAGCAENITESREENQDRMVPAFIQTQVFDASCAFSGCHGGTQSPQLTADVAYDNIVNKSGPSSSFSYITPGKPQESYLFLKIIGAPGITGSRMPRGSGPLDQVLIDSVRSWIERGAPAAQ